MVEYQAEVNYVPQGSLEPGLFILPAYTHGVSPFSVALEIHATPGYGAHEVTEYAIDFGDGSPIQKGTFSKPAEDGVKIVVVPHTYVYSKSPQSQYTGRTFYPDVTVKTKTGAVKSLNHNRQRAAEVWVKDPRYE